MVITRSKKRSLVLSLICVAYSYYKFEEILTVCFLLLTPLGLIWFSEGLGSFKGYVGSFRSIDRETPPDMIKVIGWILLIGIFVLVYIKKNITF